MSPLLRRATYEQAYLKAGGLGFAGSGKTTTAAYIAIGLAKEFGAGKPVAYFDTENGSDFLIPKFDAEGIELQNLKSTAFVDLLSVVREAEDSCSVLVVDSLSAVWRELGTAYKAAIQKKRNLPKLPSRLSMDQWGEIKDTWAPWPLAFLNSKLHIIALGRAGYEWDEEIEDIDDPESKKKLVKVGTKMKVEGEFGYEPNFIFEMLRIPAEQSERRQRSRPGIWAHRCVLLKDRTDSVNGAQFDFQKPRKLYKAGDYKLVYEKFRPVWEFMKRSDGAQRAIDPGRTSAELFSGPNGESAFAHRAKRVQIVLEEFDGTLTKIWPGQDAKSKALRNLVIETVFSTRSWTAVESKSLESLEEGLTVLHAFEEATQDGQSGALTNAPEAIALLGMCRERLKAETQAAVDAAVL